MKRCDLRARAKCPEGETCELYAEFADGSWCDDFNDNVLNRPMTNADRIRAMSDEELAEVLINVSQEVEPCNYCSPQQTFGQDCGINSVCRDGVLGWLQQPAEEVHDNG